MPSRGLGKLLKAHTRVATVGSNIHAPQGRLFGVDLDPRENVTRQIPNSDLLLRHQRVSSHTQPQESKTVVRRHPRAIPTRTSRRVRPRYVDTLFMLRASLLGRKRNRSSNCLAVSVTTVIENGFSLGRCICSLNRWRVRLSSVALVLTIVGWQTNWLTRLVIFETVPNGLKVVVPLSQQPQRLFWLLAALVGPAFHQIASHRSVIFR